MITLTNGLSDLSKELGETVSNVTTRRIGHYNDAVIEFSNEKKWEFLIKEDTSLSTVVGTQGYAMPATVLADWRAPGGIKEITLGDSTIPIIPIDWELRGDPRYDDKHCFYLNPEQTMIYFKEPISVVSVVHIHYYYVPARVESTESAVTFPIPDRYRKTVAMLAAAYVQWSRYLEQQGNRLYNLYAKSIGKISNQQSERNKNNPRRFQHYLQHIGFRRQYP